MRLVSTYRISESRWGGGTYAGGSANVCWPIRKPEEATKGSPADYLFGKALASGGGGEEKQPLFEGHTQPARSLG